VINSRFILNFLGENFQEKFSRVNFLGEADPCIEMDPEEPKKKERKMNSPGEWCPICYWRSVEKQLQKE